MFRKITGIAHQISFILTFFTGKATEQLPCNLAYPAGFT